MEFFETDRAEYRDAAAIVNAAITAADAYALVRCALAGRTYERPPFVVAVGKAAAAMAAAARDVLGEKVARGFVLTKYGHTLRAPAGFAVMEAGHPVPDEGSCAGAEVILDALADLSAEDRVILLLSGGGSAVFEKPLVSLARLQELTQDLLRSGADIGEVNCVRKALSAVKGGRFALHCAPAQVEVFALSDVLGDAPEVIASGPAAADNAEAGAAVAVVEKYGIYILPEERALLEREPVREVPNAKTHIIGNLALLCNAAASRAQELGYAVRVLSTAQQGEAREVGADLARLALEERQTGGRVALLMGGETTVQVRGHGKGGRNQELALAAAQVLEGERGVVVCSVGSDGTDGPTDAAGGIVDGRTAVRLREQGLLLDELLENNDSYTALKACGGLVVTGPTGTNVNDLMFALIDGEKL